jgi:hypothetical protein
VNNHLHNSPTSHTRELIGKRAGRFTPRRKRLRQPIVVKISMLLVFALQQSWDHERHGQLPPQSYRSMLAPRHFNTRCRHVEEKFITSGQRCWYDLDHRSAQKCPINLRSRFCRYASRMSPFRCGVLPAERLQVASRCTRPARPHTRLTDRGPLQAPAGSMNTQSVRSLLTTQAPHRMPSG